MCKFWKSSFKEKIDSSSLLNIFTVESCYECIGLGQSVKTESWHYILYDVIIIFHILLQLIYYNLYYYIITTIEVMYFVTSTSYISFFVIPGIRRFLLTGYLCCIISKVMYKIRNVLRQILHILCHCESTLHASTRICRRMYKMYHGFEYCWLRFYSSNLIAILGKRCILLVCTFLLDVRHTRDVAQSTL